MKKIPLCVNNWIFGNEEFKISAARAKQLGFDGLELLGDPSRYNASSINTIMNDNGLMICSICGFFSEADGEIRALNHPDEKVRTSTIDYSKRCIDFAKEVNARSLLIVTNCLYKAEPFVSIEVDYERSINTMRKIAEYALMNDVLLTIEPLNRYESAYTFNIRETKEFIIDLNYRNVNIIGDTFHMNIEEKAGIPNAIREAGHYLKHMHVSDTARLSPGMGAMNWVEIFRALSDIQYDGAISYEPIPMGTTISAVMNGSIDKTKQDLELRESIKFIRSIMSLNS